MRRGTICFLVLTGVLGLVALLSYEHSETQFTCLECRATRTVETLWGIKSQTVADDAVTPQLLVNYPSHQHKWCSCGSTHTKTLVGQIFACGRQHPIWQLPPSAQAQLAGMVSPEELKSTLQTIDGRDREAALQAAQKAGARVAQAE